jgi:MFS family permease
MKGLARFGAIGRALSNRDFGLYTAGNVPSLIGVWVQRVAAGWLIWELTESGTWLGLLSFADLFPIVVISPFAGVLADRFDRLAIAKVVQVIAFVQAVALTLLAVSGSITPELLVLFTLVGGIDHAFYQPVRQAMAPNLVRPEDLPSAIAINSITWNAARFIGPAVAGLILVTGDAWMAFALNSCTYTFMLFMLWKIRLTPDPKTDGDPETERRSLGIGGALMEGYRYAITHPAIGPSLLLLGVAALFARPVAELLPGFAGAVFGRGAEGLAWLTSAMGAGALVAGLWMAARGRATGMASLAVMSILAGAVFLLVFAATSNFAVAVICVAGVGAVHVVAGTAIQTMIQMVAAPRLRGRVLAFYGLLWMGGAAVGALIMGVLSEWIGLRAPVAVGGGVCLLIWLWGMTMRKRVSRLIDDRESPSR